MHAAAAGLTQANSNPFWVDDALRATGATVTAIKDSRASLTHPLNPRN